MFVPDKDYVWSETSSPSESTSPPPVADQSQVSAAAAAAGGESTAHEHMDALQMFRLAGRPVSNIIRWALHATLFR